MIALPWDTDTSTAPDGPIIYVDVGRGLDRSVIVERLGNHMVSIHEIGAFAPTKRDLRAEGLDLLFTPVTIYKHTKRASKRRRPWVDRSEVKRRRKQRNRK